MRPTDEDDPYLGDDYDDPVKAVKAFSLDALPADREFMSGFDRYGDFDGCEDEASRACAFHKRAMQGTSDCAPSAIVLRLGDGIAYRATVCSRCLSALQRPCDEKGACAVCTRTPTSAVASLTIAGVDKNPMPRLCPCCSLHVDERLIHH
jgi:hypothetical protein